MAPPTIHTLGPCSIRHTQSLVAPPFFDSAGLANGALSCWDATGDAAIAFTHAPELTAHFPVFTLTRLHSVLEAALLVCIISLAWGCGGVHKLLLGGHIIEAGTHARVEEVGDVIAAAGGPDERVGLHGNVGSHEFGGLLTAHPACIANTIMIHPKRVSNLMCNGKSSGKANVFIDAAASLWLTHTSNRCQTKSSTGFVLVDADVISGDENCCIMVSDSIVRYGISMTVPVQDRLLPLAEAV